MRSDDECCIQMMTFVLKMISFVFKMMWSGRAVGRALLAGVRVGFEPQLGRLIDFKIKSDGFCI